MTIKSNATLAKQIEAHWKHFELIKYYPFGTETLYQFIQGPKVNLKTFRVFPRIEKMSSDRLLFEITSEVSRAMRYCSTVTHDNFDNQKLDAFCMEGLFRGGRAYWSKDIIKGKSLNTIRAMEEEQIPRIEKLYGKKDSPYTEKEKRYRRKTYGVFIVDYFPLVSFYTGQQLYTHRQLQIILCMVNNSFENLC